jgi:nucleoside 2-deoxyribosyltransferase
MKFYIASGLENAALVKKVRDELQQGGDQITYDWTLHGSVQDFPDKWREVGHAEIKGVLDADFVVVILPGGKGTHTELGIALAKYEYLNYQKKQQFKIFIYEETDSFFSHPNQRICVFYYQAPCVRVVGSIEHLYRVIETHLEGE